MRASRSAGVSTSRTINVVARLGADATANEFQGVNEFATARRIRLEPVRSRLRSDSGWAFTPSLDMRSNSPRLGSNLRRGAFANRWNAMP